MASPVVASQVETLTHRLLNARGIQSKEIALRQLALITARVTEQTLTNALTSAFEALATALPQFSVWGEEVNVMHGAWVIANVCIAPDVRPILAAADTIWEAFEAAVVSTSEEAVVSRIAEACAGVARCSPGRELLFRRKLIEHLMPWFSLESSATQSVGAALRNVLCDPTQQLKFSALNGVTAVLVALERSATTLWDLRAAGIDESCENDESLNAAAVLKESVVLFCLLTKFHKHIRKMLLIDSALSALVCVLRTAPYDLQEHCISAIGDLALDEENEELLIRSGIIIPLVDLLNVPCVTVNLQAAVALNNLIANPHAEEIVRKGDGIPIIAELLTSNVDAVKEESMRLLATMAGCKDSREIIAADNRAIEHLEGLVLHPEASVSALATSTLCVIRSSSDAEARGVSVSDETIDIDDLLEEFGRLAEQSAKEKSRGRRRGGTTGKQASAVSEETPQETLVLPECSPLAQKLLHASPQPARGEEDTEEAEAPLPEDGSSTTSPSPSSATSPVKGGSKKTPPASPPKAPAAGTSSGPASPTSSATTSSDTATVAPSTGSTSTASVASTVSTASASASSVAARKASDAPFRRINTHAKSSSVATMRARFEAAAAVRDEVSAKKAVSVRYPDPKGGTREDRSLTLELLLMNPPTSDAPMRPDRSKTSAADLARPPSSASGPARSPAASRRAPEGSAPLPPAVKVTPAQGSGGVRFQAGTKSGEGPQSGEKGGGLAPPKGNKRHSLCRLAVKRRMALEKRKRNSIIIKLQPNKFRDEANRVRIMDELLATERTYVKQMKTLYTVWVRPLKRMAIMSPEDYDLCFSSVGSLYQLNASFLKHLEDAMRQRTKDTSIGDVILCELLAKKGTDNESMFIQTYRNYINAYNVCAKTLAKYMSGEGGLRTFIDDCVARCNGISLNSFLITPVQRVPRYILLLKELKEHTAPYHDDFSTLTEALDLVTLVAKVLNDAKRAVDTRSKLMSLGSQLKGYTKDLVVEKRFLLKEGSLLLEANKRAQFCYVFFFTDVLLLTRKKKDRYKFEKEVPVTSIVGVTPLPDEDMSTAKKGAGTFRVNAFQVELEGGGTLVFQADSPPLKEAWIQGLRNPDSLID